MLCTFRVRMKKRKRKGKMISINVNTSRKTNNLPACQPSCGGHVHQVAPPTKLIKTLSKSACFVHYDPTLLGRQLGIAIQCLIQKTKWHRFYALTPHQHSLYIPDIYMDAWMRLAGLWVTWITQRDVIGCGVE